MPPEISAHTSLVAVLGDPIRHSLSPAMHNAALRQLGLDWVYLALPVQANDLAVVVRALEAIDCRGLNVTLPHKRAVAELAAELTPLARRVGAVNTLVRREGGGWLGTNTDVEGFLAPLRGIANAEGVSVPDLAGGRALVLGCGGSARAVVAALVELGLERIQLAGRRPDALAAFQAECGSWAAQLSGVAWPAAAGERGDLIKALAEADLVVNTTPVGMGASSSACPLDAAELDALRAGSLIYDLIYTPRPSRLLQEGRQRGCGVLDGLEMLVQQGAAALRLWLGEPERGHSEPMPLPLAAMRQAALDQLGNA
ncbi:MULTISPECIES: shikimate dehydrogenase [unclassified Synechococcus]|uniref:shikimate dehydrogenase n=1 Tax=unclassified Synechococcus TaxID=2626047 RepID=UPI0000698381|nr:MULTISPECIES: shikimate dehydrogenase [unclassified Synechococcus]EAQ75704.1 shikimate / quinate 5-dehydrogenase [Synechococcus sp. WH 5701]WFN59624.1 shikimate dehydrogenase [Synechococcus sp. CCFWC 502]